MWRCRLAEVMTNHEQLVATANEQARLLGVEAIPEAELIVE